MTNHQLQIKQFIFGPFETNTYVVSINDQSPMSNDQSPMVLLIDPACSNDWEQQELLRYINGLSVNRSVSPEDGLSAQRSYYYSHPRSSRSSLGCQMGDGAMAYAGVDARSRYPHGKSHATAI